MDQTPYYTFLGKSIVEYVNVSFIFLPCLKLKDSGIEYVGHSTHNSVTISKKRSIEKWFGTFVHETCHIDQYNERPSWFKNKCKHIFKFNEWHEGKDVILDWLTIKNIVELEVDCERRAIEKILSEGLPIDIKKYSQEANYYISRYVKTFDTGKWKNSKAELKSLPAELMSAREILELSTIT